MTVSAWKFGPDRITVRYRLENGEYSLKTKEDPPDTLYASAKNVARETKSVMGFDFEVSLLSVELNTGDEPCATVTLSTGTALTGTAEVKCPKIGRKKKLDLEAEMKHPVLPGMDANTVPWVYTCFPELNEVLDVFLEEAAAFVAAMPRREPELFDETGEGDGE